MVKAALAAAWLLTASPAAAQEAAPTPPAATAAAVSVVTGLAPGDLLNIRATASPTGKVMARMPVGSPLKTFGCEDVNGHKWCRVEAVEDARLAGWTPARYLQTTELTGTATPASIGPNENAAAISPSPAAGGDGSAPAAQAAAERQGEEPSPAVPADLAARLGNETAPARAPEPRTQASALTGEIYSLALEGGDAPPAAGSSTLPEAPAASSLPAVSPSAAPPPAAVRPASAAGGPASAAGGPALPAPAPSPGPAARRASAPERTETAARPDPPLRQGRGVASVSPAALALCAFPVALLAFMAAILSFGSFSFTSPFEPYGTAA